MSNTTYPVGTRVIISGASRWWADRPVARGVVVEGASCSYGVTVRTDAGHEEYADTDRLTVEGDAHVSIGDPDDPHGVPIYEGPAEGMTEHLLPGTYTDSDGREWTVPEVAVLGGETRYVVVETIRHGSYSHHAEHSGDTVEDATRAALAASPYNMLAVEDASKVAGLVLALVERGEGELGWARYSVREV